MADTANQRPKRSKPGATDGLLALENPKEYRYDFSSFIYYGLSNTAIKKKPPKIKIKIHYCS